MGGKYHGPHKQSFLREFILLRLESFGTTLKLITHVKNNGCLFRVHEIMGEGGLKFKEIKQFKEELLHPLLENVEEIEPGEITG